MARFGLCGPAYQSESPAADYETLVNWYVEHTESDGARSATVLYPRPGLTAFCLLPDSPVRAECEINGRLFIVAGAGLYEVLASGSLANGGSAWGSVTNDGNPAQIIAGQTQFFIVSANNTYYFTLATNTFGQISVDLPAAGPYTISASTGSVVVGKTTYPISNISESGSVVTIWLITQSTPTARAGDLLTVSGVTPSGYNGTFAITSINSVTVQAQGNNQAFVTYTSITYTNATTGLSSWRMGEYHTLDYTQGLHPIASLSQAAGSVTITTPDYWPLPAGITVSGTLVIDNCSLSGYTNLQMTITSVTAVGNGYQIVCSGAPAGTAGLAGGSGEADTLSITLTSGVTPSVSIGQHVVLASVDNTAYNGTWTVTNIRHVRVSGSDYYIINVGPTSGILSQASSQNGTVAPQTTTTIAASQGAFCDGYFLRLLPTSNQWGVSKPLDCTNWDLTQTSAISVFPDNIVSLIVDHREVVIFGRTRTVVYYDSGNTFPFDVVQGGFIENGCAAPFSPIRLDNSIFFLGQDERGSLMAWRLNGYLPVRVSHHGVEQEWQGYATADDAVSYSYQWNGHTFWGIWFPTANTTWEYDVATGTWHKAAYWTGSAFVAQKWAFHAFAFGLHIVGDKASGQLYQLSSAATTDNGDAITFERTAPSIGTELEYTFFDRLVLDVEDPAASPATSSITLTWTDDNWTTTAVTRTLDTSQAGHAKKRVVTYRLGKSRHRIFRLRTTNAIRIIDGYVDASGTGAFHPQERLTKQFGKIA